MRDMPSEDELPRLLWQANSAGSASADGASEAGVGEGGLSVRIPGPPGLWARLTVAGSGATAGMYSWKELWLDQAGPSWSERADGFNGTHDGPWPAIEVSFNATLAAHATTGPIVWLEPNMAGEGWIFKATGSGGGTTSPLTTKGDLWGYSTADARVPVGTDTHVLTADSTVALGVKWAAPGASSGITVEEQDGSPSYASITEIQFHQDDGFVVSQPGAGQALIRHQNPTYPSGSTTTYASGSTLVMAGPTWNITQDTTATISNTKILLFTGSGGSLSFSFLTVNFAANVVVGWAGAALNFTVNTAWAIASGITWTINGPGTLKINAPLEVCGELAWCVVDYDVDANDVANVIDNLVLPTVLGQGKVVLRLYNAAANFTITGIAPREDYQVILLVNDTSYTCTLEHNGTTSTAVNRFSLPASNDLDIFYNGTQLIWHDTGTSPAQDRWLTGCCDPAYTADGTTLQLIGNQFSVNSVPLLALHALTPAADKGLQFTGGSSASTYDLTAAGKALLDDATAGDQRTTLGATTVGGNVFTLANPSATTWLRVNSNNTVTARTASETRTDLSLATIATTGSGADLTDDTVTLAKIANASASSVLLGSGSSGSGTNYTELTLGTGLAMNGTVLNATGEGSELGVLYVETASKTVANTVTETTLMNAGFSFTSADIAAGTTYRLTVGGVIGAQNVASQVCTVRVYMGATAVASVSLAGMQNVTNRAWRAEVELTIRTTGAPGTAAMNECHFWPLTSTTANQLAGAGTPSPTTSSNPAFDVTAQWGAANANNTITMSTLILEKLS